jgi:hypothetical protein
MSSALYDTSRLGKAQLGLNVAWRYWFEVFIIMKFKVKVVNVHLINSQQCTFISLCVMDFSFHFSPSPKKEKKNMSEIKQCNKRIIGNRVT